MASYSGPLKAKRKAELITIAHALNLKASDQNTKVELENTIKEGLHASKEQQENPRFAGLWQTIAGQERRSRDRSDASEPSPEPMEDETTTTSAASPRVSRRLSAMTPRSQTMERAQKALQTTVGAAEDTAQAAAAVGQEMVVRASKVEVEPLHKTYERFKKQQLFPVVHGVQKQLSNSWTLIGLTLCAELFFILAVSIPYTTKTMAGTPWAFFKLTPEHPWDLTLPDYAVLSRLSFWRVLFGWALTNIALPLLFSYLVIFPRPARSVGTSASPITFSIVRLVVGLYVQRIAPAPLVDFAGTVVERFADLQLLAASTGLAFAAYAQLA